VAQFRYTELLLRDGEHLERQGEWEKARELYARCHDNFVRLGESPVLANLCMAYANGHGPGIVAEFGEDHTDGSFFAETAISSDGRYIAIGTNLQVGVYDVIERKYCFQRELGGADAGGITFLDNDRTLCLATLYGLRAWDIQTGDQIFKSHGNSRADLICEAGANIAVYDNEELTLLDRRTLLEVGKVQLGKHNRFTGMVASADGTAVLLVGGPNRTADAQIVKHENGTLSAHPVRVAGKRVVSGKFLADGRFLLGLDDGSLAIFDVGQMRGIHRRELLQNPVAQVGWHEATSQAFAADDQGQVAFCGGSDLRGDGKWPTLQVEPDCKSVAFTADGTRIALSTVQRPFRVYELRDSKSIPVVEGQVGIAFALPLNDGL
jgi:WD40 repeat protein